MTEAINYGSAASGTVTIGQAALALDLPESTLRFWIDRRGCPVARKGGRGRGRATLVDPVAIRRWMDGRDQPTAPTTEHDVMLAYAERLPALLADALYNAWRETDGPAKRQLAASVACAWYQAASAELDRLRDLHPDIPHVTTVPEAIVKLKLIV